ncbi:MULTISPECIES: PerC family transcriptional regulator [Enterobacter]|uniref:PerC family transcriptional regulator n=1 Tax=Enterobacter TaxID=547 RepID=UPI001CBE3E1C|nr:MULTISPECIES: PerC family transcriptional regulator [Enterobacter]UAN16168.1 PerC family transcriptional regulator [Enterobacter asburiae]UAN20954.1 PerC family transcriptional regulator [Enterobacter sp. JBIWA003]UAN30790.1 PerC family transcriptional regulator [Enterobacter sp. JBIWA005]
MVKDSKAEELEAKGLYRRAARRWQDVMMTRARSDEQEWVRRRCDSCLAKLKSQAVKADDYGDLHKAATGTQHHRR